jgi:predicted small lipoprotein YifL
MKKLNLFLIPVLFSSLLIGCGMKGPLYRAPETQQIKEQPATPEKTLTEQTGETVESE